jgi:hypothetical protein
MESVAGVPSPGVKTPPLATETAPRTEPVPSSVAPEATETALGSTKGDANLNIGAFCHFVSFGRPQVALLLPPSRRAAAGTKALLQV